MEFRDLGQQYRLHRDRLDRAIQSVLDRTDFIGGSKVGELEARLADYVGVRHCITCANGTDALQLALMAWGIGEGAAVFVPDFTFFSSGEVVPLVGATPVFVDIEEGTYNISPERLDQAVQHVLCRTDLEPRAVIAVDLFGQPADHEQIRQIADRYGLLVLEDGAQGFGGMIGGQRACSFGDISTTSFFPAKPLGCYGDGGAVFTDDDGWAGLIRSYQVHGKGKDKYDNVRIGMNSRLDTIQAAVLLEKLEFFDEEIERCGQIALEYERSLAGFVSVPSIKEGYRSVWAQYTICFADGRERGQAVAALREEGIPTAVYYRRPMHQQPAFSGYALQGLGYSVAEKVCGCCLSLPMHPYLSMDDIGRTIGTIKRIREREL